MKRKNLRWLGAAPVLAALVALSATGGAAASPTASPSAACKKATNIEAIIDDSGSMSGTDINKYRASLLEILAGLQGNTGKKMGAVQFGDFSSVLFNPLAIGNAAAAASVTAAMVAIDADGSTVSGDFAGTNYDAAFDGANAANPTADARVFLSDGEPNSGTYTRSKHQNPATKTYVVGFGGVGSSSTPLNEIVTDTGGQLFALTDSSQVQPVAGALTALFNCKKPPITKTAVLTQGKVKAYSFKAGGKTADILITWPTSSSTIAPIIGGGGARASTAKVRTKIQKGATFSSVHIKGLRKGAKFKFKIKAKKAAAPTLVTTQIIR